MDFTINRIEAKETSNDNKISATIWGRKPKAVTFEVGRIFKFENLFWKSRSFIVETPNGEALSYPDREEEVLALLNKKGVLAINKLSVYADTKLNDQLIIHTF